jgi:hypothetical protein
MNDNILFCEIANQLNITELEVFERAYYHWHRSTYPNPQALECLYGMVIMSRASCPFWVRDYCRRVKEALEDDDLKTFWELSNVGQPVTGD